MGGLLHSSGSYHNAFFISNSPRLSSLPLPQDGSYVSIDLALDPKVDMFPDINFTLKPAKGEQMYILLVSNCAFVDADGQKNKVNYLEWDGMTLTWVLNEGGNLGELGGLIWFYAICFVVYIGLAVQWVRKSMQFEGQLLGLQKAVSNLVYGEVSFLFGDVRGCKAGFYVANS